MIRGKTAFCTNCGRELLGTQAACPYCGASTTSSTGVGIAETAGGAWMPLTAGILDIIAGAIQVLFGRFAPLGMTTRTPVR